MAHPRRVIEDSDEEDGSYIATEMLSPSVETNEVGVIPVMHPSSTDPILFRAVYEEHFGQLVVDDQFHNHRQSPVLEDPIIDQHMSSSVSITSGRKLKRSKTATESSSSFATEPRLSNRATKSMELMRNADDLSQITTTRMSKDAMLQDPWEVPPSSTSDQPSYVDKKLKTRNAERNSNRKTYGRQIRRAQTVAHTAKMTLNDQRLSPPLEDEMPRIVNQNRSAQNQEDGYLPAPKPKRQKIESATNGDLPEYVRMEFPEMNHKEAFPDFSNSTSAGVESTSIRAQRSVSEHSDMGSSKSAAIYVHDFSSLPFTAPIDSEAIIEESYLLENSLAAQISRKARGPIVIVPDALSDEQKLQYDIVSVASTSQSRRSSLPEILGTHHSNIQHTGYSCTVSNGTPVPESTLARVEDGLSAKLPPSGSQLSVTKRKMKRAKSEVGSKQKSISAMPSNHSKVAKRKGRSKTLTQGERQSCREASLDELSLTPEEVVRNKVSSRAFTKPGKEKIHVGDRGEPTRTEEINAFGATNLTEEQYQSRQSLPRSESISANASNDDSDLRFSKASFDWEESIKAKDTHGYVADFSAGKGVPEGTVRQSESFFPKRIPDIDDTDQKPENILVVQTETKTTLPAQTKKRGRKKTSEAVATKSHRISAPSPSKNSDVQRKALCEKDSNQKTTQETPSASPTKDGVLPAQTAQTPTKDSKRGLDQHSPIQGGKVPYRVGLSKKTRIAPLLKMIRK